MTNIYKYIVFIALCLVQLNILAQTGTIKGTVSDLKTGETLIGATVYIQGTTVGTTTDIDGNYILKNIQPGTYNLISSYISYNQSIIRVSVEKGNETNIEFKLEPATVTIAEVTVKAVKRTDTEMSMITSIKSNAVVSTGIASQQISRSQDRDASEVIRRVPGVTIIEDRFVMVRGLSQRYNNVLLNNAPAPSSETDVRAFSFDVIPSSMIDRMVIYQTPAPEIPADFAGGVIKIFTKNIPESNQISVNYTAGYLSNTTGEQFVKGPVGKYDYLGFDDGSRALPDGFPSSLSQYTSADYEKVDAYALKLNRSWSRDTSPAPIDNKLSVTLSRRFNIGNATLGNITSVNYSNTYSIKDEDRRYYENATTLTTDYRYNTSKNSAKMGVVHNWSLAFGRNNKIEFRNLYNHNGYSATTFRKGLDNSIIIKGLQFSFFERGTYSGQLGGEHQLSYDNDKLDWVVGYSNASRNEPGIRRFGWTVYTSDDPEDPYNNKDFALLQGTADPRFAGILFLNSNENIVNIASNYEHKFLIGEDFKPSVKAGFYIERKKRQFDARLLGYIKNSDASFYIQFMPIDTIFSPNHIGAQKWVTISEATDDANSYSANNDLVAGYIGLNIPFAKKINLYTGVRYENNTLDINSYQHGINIKKPLNATVKSSDFFPSANLTVNFTDKQLLRLAYGKTTNRPEFREKAPMIFYVFEQAASVEGDTSLRNAYINNFDLRYEFYPSESEIITIGAFYKKFIDPIEMIVDTKQSGLNYGFVNAQDAYNYGLEFELRKNLSFINLAVVKDISLSFNAALINSQVDVVDKKDSTLNRKRPMQGQSPYIINTGMFYQNDPLRLQVSVMYNVIGRRIVFVGDGNETPDIYEEPRNLLDITVTKKLGKYYQIKAGIQDLLNDPFENTQKFSKDGKEVTTMYYKTGAYYTLSVGMNF